MNSRIRTLADQSSKEAFPVGSMAWMETFARLIVEDCISISTKVDKNPYIPEGDQAKKIIRELKEHFGVEE